MKAIAVLCAVALAVTAVQAGGSSLRRAVIGSDVESWSHLSSEQLMHLSVFGASPCATTDIPGFDYAKGFAEFCKKYGKVYKANTYNLRFATWKASKNCVEFKNSNSPTNHFFLRTNHLNDHTADEFLQSLGTRDVNLNVNPNTGSTSVTRQSYAATSSQSPSIPASAGRGPSAAFAFAEVPSGVLAPEQPVLHDTADAEEEDADAFVDVNSRVSGDAYSGKSFDWRQRAGVVNPTVYYQRSCGNCWAWVCKTIAESAWRIAGNNFRALSVQQITDCATAPAVPTCNGCKGGVPGEALKYFVDNKLGLCAEKDYQYKGSQGTCKQCTKVAQLSGVSRYYRPTNEADLFEHLKVGPVAIGLVASPNSFMSYGGGVYDDPKCNTVEKINHGMTLVGYGTDPKNGDYWILRNSWAASWGESGYMRIRRGQNQCKLVTQWVTVTSSFASMFGIADGPMPGANTPAPVVPLSPCQTKPDARGIVTRGICQDVLSCTDNGGKPTAGLCPGASNIQCCLNAATVDGDTPSAPNPSTPSVAPVACRALHPVKKQTTAGTCIPKGICIAAMNFPVGGACPGAADIQCCLQK